MHCFDTNNKTSVSKPVFHRDVSRKTDDFFNLQYIKHSCMLRKLQLGKNAQFTPWKQIRVHFFDSRTTLPPFLVHATPSRTMEWHFPMQNSGIKIHRRTLRGAAGELARHPLLILRTAPTFEYTRMSFQLGYTPTRINSYFLMLSRTLDNSAILHQKRWQNCQFFLQYFRPSS